MLYQWNIDSFSSATTARPTGLLARLNAVDRDALWPFLESVTVARGTKLFDVADSGDHIYLPQGPLISIGQGNDVEVALVGSEGIVGWPALIGCTASPFEASVCGRDGVIFKVRTRDLCALVAARPEFGQMLSCVMNAVGLQMAETIGAAASHRLDLRLARWLLLRHDRLGGDEILVHHGDIAINLGTRRASITDTLHVLEGAGLVRGRRGRIVVRDRRGLESVAAGCYGASESLYRMVIGPFGKPSSGRVETPRLVAH